MNVPNRVATILSRVAPKATITHITRTPNVVNGTVTETTSTATVPVSIRGEGQRTLGGQVGVGERVAHIAANGLSFDPSEGDTILHEGTTYTVVGEPLLRHWGGAALWICRVNG